MADHKRKYPLLQDASFGDKVDLFLTKDRAISCSAWCKLTLAATVLGRFNGGGFTSVLVGWKAGEERARYAGGRYVHSIEDERRLYGDATYIDDINSYANGVWISGHWSYKGNGIIDLSATSTVSGLSGPFRYIKVRDVHSGDTVAWCIPGPHMQYCICDDVSEDENHNGDPMIVVHGNVFSKHGMSRVSSGYPLSPSTDILLINRGTQ